MLISAIFLTAVSAGTQCELKKPLAGMLGKKRVTIPLGEVVTITQADKPVIAVTAKVGVVKVLAKTLEKQCVPVAATPPPASPSPVAVTPAPASVPAAAPTKVVVAAPTQPAPAQPMPAESPRKIRWVEDDRSSVTAAAPALSAEKQKQRNLGYILGGAGVGLIGAGIGTYFGGAALADAAILRSDRYRGNPLRTREEANAVDADKRVVVAMDALTYTFIGLGVAGIGGGIAMFVLSTRADTPVALVPGAGSVHLAGRFP